MLDRPFPPAKIEPACKESWPDGLTYPTGRAKERRGFLTTGFPIPVKAGRAPRLGNRSRQQPACREGPGGPLGQHLSQPFSVTPRDGIVAPALSFHLNSYPAPPAAKAQSPPPRVSLNLPLAALRFANPSGEGSCNAFAGRGFFCHSQRRSASGEVIACWETPGAVRFPDPSADRKFERLGGAVCCRAPGSRLPGDAPS